jgi:hypothetical protein
VIGSRATTSVDANQPAVGHDTRHRLIPERRRPWRRMTHFSPPAEADGDYPGSALQLGLTFVLANQSLSGYWDLRRAGWGPSLQFAGRADVWHPTGSACSPGCVWPAPWPSPGGSLSAERGARGLQLAQRLTCELAEFLLIGGVGPAGESTLEGEDAELGSEARSRIGYTSLQQCLRHGRG